MSSGYSITKFLDDENNKLKYGYEYSGISKQEKAKDEINCHDVLIATFSMKPYEWEIFDNYFKNYNGNRHKS